MSEKNRSFFYYNVQYPPPYDAFLSSIHTWETGLFCIKKQTGLVFRAPMYFSFSSSDVMFDVFMPPAMGPHPLKDRKKKKKRPFQWKSTSYYILPSSQRVSHKWGPCQEVGKSNKVDALYLGQQITI